jgi:hypothetical protein
MKRSGEIPAFCARMAASAALARVVAESRLLRALTRCPVPWSPTKKIWSPNACKISEHLSKTACFPPTITDNFPSLARNTPPLTGASSISTPSASSRSAMLRVEEGLELDVSIRTLPAESPPARPSSPSTTSSTTSEFGRESSTTSVPTARAFRFSTGSAGVSPKRDTASGFTS